MKLDERLKKDADTLEKLKRQYDDDETMEYKPYVAEGFLNERKSTFKGFGDEGLNNARSIFDAQALFKKGEGYER